MIINFAKRWGLQKLAIVICLGGLFSLTSQAAPPTNKCSEPFWSYITHSCFFFCDVLPPVRCVIDTTEANCHDSKFPTKGLTPSCWNDPVSGFIQCHVGGNTYYCRKQQPPITWPTDSSSDASDVLSDEVSEYLNSINE